MLEYYIDVIEDLSRDLPSETRYRRLLQAITTTIPADAIALLQLQGNILTPLAVSGLRPAIKGRHFDLEHHPRLAHIMSSREAVRFAQDSPLPDPYDGLIDHPEESLPVHDCMGIPLYIDDQPWGVITLDALQPDRFNDVSAEQQQTAATLTQAVITAAQRIYLLEQQLSRGLNVTAEINREQAGRPLIGHSPAMQQLLQRMEAVAATPLTVLLQGETGVGKEIVSRHLHLLSDRLEHPFVQVNCAALPESLAEAELFGHTEGAFTGAGKHRSGRFELADGGTLFLDEVGELPLTVQAKLLRAIQEGELQRMGSDEPIKVNVRIIAATNRDLNGEVQAGRFRADLYHRLSVYPLTIPPLRERGDDVLELAEHFLERDQHRLNIPKLVITHAARQALRSYQWPGNIRELEHVLSRAALHASMRPKRNGMVQIDAGDLDIDMALPAATPPPPVEINTTMNMNDAVNDFKRELIEQRLKANNNNVAATARALSMDRSNLLRLIQRLGVR